MIGFWYLKNQLIGSKEIQEDIDEYRKDIGNQWSIFSEVQGNIIPFKAIGNLNKPLVWMDKMVKQKINQQINQKGNPIYHYIFE